MVMVSKRRGSEEAWERQSFRKACFGFSIYIVLGGKSGGVSAWVREVTWRGLGIKTLGAKIETIIRTIQLTHRDSQLRTSLLKLSGCIGGSCTTEDVGEVVSVPFPSFPPSFAPTPSFFSVPPPAPPPPPKALVALRGEKSLLVPLLGERMDEDEEEEGGGEVGMGRGDLDVEVEEEVEEEAEVSVGAGAVGCEVIGKVGSIYVTL